MACFHFYIIPFYNFRCLISYHKNDYSG